MNAFADALSVIFADPNLGAPATYTPPGGGTTVACSVMLNRGNRDLPGDSRSFSAGATLDVLATALTPARGGTFQVGTETLKVFDDPRRDDPDRFVWTCTVG